ncbi:MAG: TonB-dependent receptor [Pseudomonadota bacterium]|uniref:TonB-dependent receptor n=1 Tax=Phenylobacterium sp. TaxID=1871053 RepID=UPI0025E328A2|nr:TonB-dependent receptor [Phenylobacterium sp.]MBT9473174.1 TonB-dependent receptor [Phenylobacterium sp.]
MFTRSILAASAAVQVLMLATAAHAQSNMEIEEVVVTAQRREETAQSTPLAITALSADQLEKQGVRTVTDLTTVVPGVQIGSVGGSVEIAVRGIGSTNNTEVGDPAVAFNVDGVYMARPRSAAGLFFDLDRTEVLRGPQGTLYGRNATAGSLNVITKKPTSEYEANAQLELGNYSLIRASGAVNLPFSDKVAVRAAFQTAKRDGYTSNAPSNDYNDEDAVALRLHVLLKPTENFSLLLSGDYFRNDYVGSASAPLGQYAAGGDPYTFPISRDGASNQQNYGLSAQADLDLSFGVLTYLGAIRNDLVHTLAGSGRNYRVGAPRPPSSCDPVLGLGCNTIYFDSDEQQESHELRLGNAEGRFKWVGGLYYFKETNNVYANIFPLVAFIQPNTYSDSKAVFAQGTYSFTDQLRATAGLRYTRDHKGRTGGTYVALNSNGGCQMPGGMERPFFGAPPPGCLLYGNVADFTWESTDYKLGMEFDLTPTSLLFVSTSTGYKAGGYGDGLPPLNNKYEPERLTAYEVGAKNRFMENRAQLNLSAFYYDYQDFQVTGTGVVAGQPSAVTVNAAKATLYGAELEGTLLITENDRIDGSAAYLHAEYKDFALLGGDSFSPGFADYSGLTLAKSPEWTFNLGYQHSWSFTNDGRLTVRVQTHYESSKNLDYHNFDVTEQDAYTKTDLIVTYDAPGGVWSLMAYGRNLEDEAVLVQGSPDAQNVNRVAGSGAYAPPRLYGVQLSARF